MAKAKKSSPRQYKQKTRILLCSLYGRSGMLQYASQLANSLTKYYDVHVLLPDYSDTFLFDKKVKLIRIKAPPSAWKTALLSINPFHFYSMIKKIKKVDPELIHFVDNHPWSLVILNAFKDKKFYVTMHDITPHLGEGLKGKITIHVNQVLNRKADRVAVLGYKLRDDLVKLYKIKKDKISVFLMGDFSFYLKWKKPGIREDDKTILFFGRILEYKGLDTLLKAMPILTKKIPDIKLIVAGEGDMLPYNKLVEKIDKKNIEVLNKYIPEQAVPPYFQESSIIVMPYRDASSSGIVPIAYVFKKALVCTDVGALREFIDDGKTGILVKPEDPKALADAIVKLIHDKKKREFLGENGYKKAMGELSWASIAQRLSKEYNDILKKK
ncbi:MAG TPA: glycosyltransferase family 4 protein [Alphaproteobacteria bacterium]|nr:glycosyltransferase family 4 protein [Alphaproteobacteria bacterium]